MEEKLKDIIMFLKWAHISREYFGKSSSWIYQRLGGYEVNNRPAEFTEKGKVRMREALHDLARRIAAAADNI